MRIFYYIFKILIILFIQTINVYSHEIEYTNSFQLNGKINFLHEIEAVNEDGNFNAVIEIPAGTNEKWEVSKDGTSIALELKNGVPRIINYLGYPFNYGFIPKTIVSIDDGGDGDAIDVVVLSQKKLKKGMIVPVKVIGMLLMKDKGKIDNKIISVLVDSKFEKSNSIKKLDKLYPGILEIINMWFENYKGIKIVTSGFVGKKDAKEFLMKGQSFYEKNN
ncbi:MAG: hypothetical protein CBC25_00665 [Pelagibacteraceae bacterium TMED65]|nr:MAG: hypothetical protein CBC25_00665 [Pelagibacteraceae bacterium TMED65]|tara:strand:+ start:4673 stop:5332 length:660 start_codon:yes stop_codon:yes gene_type:complete